MIILCRCFKLFRSYAEFEAHACAKAPPRPRR